MTLRTNYKILLSCLCSLFLLCDGPCFADESPTVLYKQANDLYSKSNYREAAKVYEKIANSGYRSADLYFNMGNAFYKMGSIPSAVLYYEKALKLSPGDDDINFNLRLARTKTNDKIDEVPRFFLEDWWKSLILFFSADSLAIWSLVLLFGGFALLVLYLFTGSAALKKTAFFIGLTFVFLGLLSCFTANRQLVYADSYAAAILFSPVVNVKASPNQDSKAIFILHEGSKVEILQTERAWVEIQLPNGNKGWILYSDIKQI